jgi:hypothetical protein
MPASRLSKSRQQLKGKAYAKELTFVQKKDRNGGISFVPLEVPTSSTPPYMSTSPSTSRSPQPPPSHKMVIDNGQGSLHHDLGASKKSQQSKKVFSSFLIFFAFTI